MVLPFGFSDKARSIGRDSCGRGTFEEEWRKRFEGFAKDYEADSLISGWSESGLQRRLALCTKLLRERKLPDPARILDLGCGAGTYVRALADLSYRVVGLDYSIPSLFRALVADRKRAGEYVGGEAYNLPFRNESFDVVISIGILQALWRPEYALDEVVRILRPGGVLIVEFLNAFELIANMKSASERLIGRLPRVRSYSPFQVNHWLAERGIRFLQRAGVYLPPRKLPWLERIFSLKGFIPLLEKTPGISLLSPHAFLMVGEKRGG